MTSTTLTTHRPARDVIAEAGGEAAPPAARGVIAAAMPEAAPLAAREVIAAARPEAIAASAGVPRTAVALPLRAAAPARPSLLGRLVRRGLTVLLAALTTAALAVAAAAAGGVAPHVELSDSMAPVLRAGDVVWLDRVAAGEARVGDVVAFDDPEREATVLHRVTRIDDRGGRLAFTTRGDANNASERWTIGRDGTVGRYAGFRVPHAGRAVVALKGAPLALVALLSGAVLTTLLLRRIWSS